MRFAITPLGGAGRAVGRIVDAIVRYLQPRTPEPPGPGALGVGGPEGAASGHPRATAPTAAQSPAAGADEVPGLSVSPAT
ncbi:MAG: hypothetical protein ACRD0V_15200 [Acidimicrobiales bacterium]